ncbi:hypothetical protein G6F37_008782 [Rhizopus arrhizus]|nr:hypothetical protein G6F38_007866 [Rhizopus arrhizus]KAG1155174.1 hypothetical protein G6F37_008782 [Rhizopus arrhizus]
MTLIQKLPRASIRDDVNKAELCTRFIEPFLSDLFDDPDQGYYLRWTNARTLEAKEKSADTTVERPDLCITKSLGRTWHHYSGFGEAKAAKMGENMYLSGQPEHARRHGNPNSGPIDHILCFDSTGNWFVRMLELAELKIPDSLEDSPKLALDISKILKVLDVFHRVCVPMSDSALNNRRTTIITNLSISQLFTTSQDRNRDSSLKRRHN